MFWDMAAKHELWLPRCVDTGQFFFPPQHTSPFTGGDMRWEKASGRATLASYVITQIPAPGYEKEVPYIIALAATEEGPRLTCNLLGVPPDPAKLRVGMPLRVVFEDRGSITIPQFTLAEGTQP
jgi:uncharacterized OB-fold protein